TYPQGTKLSNLPLNKIPIYEAFGLISQPNFLFSLKYSKLSIFVVVLQVKLRALYTLGKQ
ncbi:hypothetical protein ACQP3F_28785, partial [Escherichia coli]